MMITKINVLKSSFAITLALCTLLMASNSLAQSPLGAQLEIFQVQQFGSAGQLREELTEVQNVHPGTHLEYVLTYRNTSNQALAGFDVLSPIPENTYYLPGTVELNAAHQFQVSLDGGATWQNEPVTRMVTDAQGMQFMEEVPTQSYTDLRWLISAPLAPQQQVQIRYRVQVR